MTSPVQPAVGVYSATVGYRRVVVLEDVSFEVQTGEFFAIVGPNGSGKTTLLRTLLGVITPLRGKISVDCKMGYAPQRKVLDDLFPFTAHEVVAHGLICETTLDRKSVRARVREALESCGIAERAELAYRDLSGGQKQRVLIARALVTQPQTLVLDEPTNDLDVRGEHDVMNLVAELNARGTTVLMVSHQLHVVERYAQRIAVIADGRVVSGERDEMLAPERLESLFGIKVDLVSGRPSATAASSSSPSPRLPTDSDRPAS